MSLENSQDLVGALNIIEGLRDSVWKYVNDVESSIEGLGRGEIKKQAVMNTLNNTLELLELAFPREIQMLKPILPQILDTLIEEAVDFGNKYIWNKSIDFLTEMEGLNDGEV